MLIRNAQREDFDAVATLTNHYILGTAVHFGYDPVTAEELAEGWARYKDRFPYLVAEIEGQFAGYAKAGTWRDRTAYSWIAETGIYVRPELHGRGVGRGLYRVLLDTLREQGFHAAIGGITIPNDVSVRLHESLGFVHVGTVKEAGWKFNTWHDAGFWQVVLREHDHRAAHTGPTPVVRVEIPNSSAPAA